MCGGGGGGARTNPLKQPRVQSRDTRNPRARERLPQTPPGVPATAVGRALGPDLTWGIFEGLQGSLPGPTP